MHEAESRPGAKAVAAVMVGVDAKVPIPKPKPEVIARAPVGPKTELVPIDIVETTSKASKTLVVPTIEQAANHTKRELAGIDSADLFGSILEADPETKHSLEAINHKY